jgi:hypothetical protein
MKSKKKRKEKKKLIRKVVPKYLSQFIALAYFSPSASVLGFSFFSARSLTITGSSRKSIFVPMRSNFASGQ